MSIPMGAAAAIMAQRQLARSRDAAADRSPDDANAADTDGDDTGADDTDD